MPAITDAGKWRDAALEVGSGVCSATFEPYATEEVDEEARERAKEQARAGASAFV